MITGKPTTGAQRQQTRFKGKANPSSAGSGSSYDGIPKIPGLEESNTCHYAPGSNLKKKKIR